jgi:hypothetical protein
MVSLNVYSQTAPDQALKGKNDTIKVGATLINGELIPWLPLNDVTITERRIFRSAAERAQFNRLRYNVLKVLPYAILARNKYTKLQQDLAITGNRKEQRALVKNCEKDIKDLFDKKIKDMSINQGEILIKLIDRETGNSSYEMVRQLQGGIKAFSYQLVARVFGHDLKEKYNPEEQRDIESILQSTGYYSRNN